MKSFTHSRRRAGTGYEIRLTVELPDIGGLRPEYPCGGSCPFWLTQVEDIPLFTPQNVQPRYFVV